ncbi:hypothetical protein [Aeoliella mucimassa]|uniref:SMP-30/Gluconolaconase/LRE-like region n=1 Tax=Aeoliella mucimassa TaxID=2527972 RepID=A0A518AM77_9BACT|nr:hypothetical protein [Aeoliella mucimassa]QDU55826.1 hypothetical protein Pan181_20230 [Aeoliella mucimassa]
MVRSTALLLAISLVSPLANALEPTCETLARWDAPEATQGVAVDAEAFYAIANAKIAKYDKQTGVRLDAWEANDDLPLRHLNSGVCHEGKLYCAHSNFPAYPNTSSVEIFETENLQHIDSHSFGIYEGSLTVADWHNNAWWCVFAHYSEKVNDDPQAKPHTYTSLVKFDDEWRRLEAWVFPSEVLERFAPHSCSGGVWSQQGRFYCSGHDRPELYELALPRAASTLVWKRTLGIEITGQAIAMDPSTPEVIYGIDRPHKQVIVSRLPALFVNE